MAASQRPAPPPQRTESDRPIRAGCCDMQSAVITALSREERGKGQREPPRPRQDPSQTNRMSRGARGHVHNILIPPLHVAPAIKSS